MTDQHAWPFNLNEINLLAEGLRCRVAALEAVCNRSLSANDVTAVLAEALVARRALLARVDEAARLLRTAPPSGTYVAADGTAIEWPAETRGTADWVYITYPEKPIGGAGGGGSHLRVPGCHAALRDPDSAKGPHRPGQP